MGITKQDKGSGDGQGGGGDRTEMGTEIGQRRVGMEWSCQRSISNPGI